MIAARLTRDRGRSSYFLRGSKFLANSEWSGERYTLNYKTPAELRAALDGIRLDYIVLDTSAPSTPDLRLMEAAVADPGWKWLVLAHVSVMLRSRQGELLVYHRDSPGRRPAFRNPCNWDSSWALRH
jgi:hypothetical protein